MINYVKCKELESERLILRPFTLDDVNSMYKNWATDQEAVIQMPWNVHESLDETKSIVSTWVDSYKNDFFYKWVIYSKEENDIIGDITVVHSSISSENCEVGYIIGSKWWNKGFMTEALKLVLNFLLIEVGFNLVYAQYDIQNPASGRVMEKAGMKYECTMREKHKRKDGTFADLNYYSIKKEELK